VINCEKDHDLYQTEKKLSILKSFKKKKSKKEELAPITADYYGEE
jgi:hypothetical protein